MIADRHTIVMVNAFALMEDVVQFRAAYDGTVKVIMEVHHKTKEEATDITNECVKLINDKLDNELKEAGML